MEESARRYARNILLMHLALLAIVVLLVFFAGREIYESTRQQVLEQTLRRQSLLANQTGRGIESFYDSIFSDLDLLQRSENDDTSLPFPQLPPRSTSRPDFQPRPTSRPDLPPRPTSRPGQRLRGFIFARPLWKQLEGRVTHLFLFDRTTQNATLFGQQPNSLVLNDILDRSRPWLNSIKGKAISSFQLFGDQGINLVCIPADPENTKILVAVVPVSEIEGHFLNKINEDANLGATLIDDSFLAMATSNRKLIGVNLLNVSDESLKAYVVSEITKGDAFSLTVNQSINVGDVQFQPAIVAFEPINVLSKRWWVYIALPISEVNGVLDHIFRRALIWAVFVVISVTAILVSTSIQMIRGRIRAERMRHDVLKRELEQARQIQLAWLPTAMTPGSRVDIAAINQPASHISGDFYNWFELPDGRTVVTIGDVTGHGMSAAFLMATTQLLVRTTMLRFGEPGRCMAEINQQLCQQVFNGQFVTMLILVIDPKEHCFEIAVGGHPPPLVWDGRTFAVLPATPELVLGVERDSEYPTERYAFTEGSQLVMYTDGVIDALSPEGKRFTADGFNHIPVDHYGSAQSLLNAVVDGVSRFRGRRELIDDLTLLTIQLHNGSPEDAA